MMYALFWHFMLIGVLTWSSGQAVPPLIAPMAVRETGWVRAQEVSAHVAIEQAQLDPKEVLPKPIPPSPPRPPGTGDKKPGGAAGRSGFTGTTSVRVMSGVPGGQATGGLRSVEFAIAPLAGEQPVYDKAIFITSDAHGHYEVALPPGRYWIGPKAKARHPNTYRPGAMEVPEEVAVVKEGELTQLDLVAVGYAP